MVYVTVVSITNEELLLTVLDRRVYLDAVYVN